MAEPLNVRVLLGAMKKYGASDLHLKAGVSPYYRVERQLRSLNMPPLSGEDIEKALSTIIPPSRRHIYDETGDLDFSTELPDGDRFRVNVFRAGDRMNASIRRVNSEIPKYEQIHLPPVYGEIVERSHEGIIIVCGVTGSGKSTTLASMIQHINRTRRANIVTIEDPVEYLFKPDKSIISQREIGIDIAGYDEGLKYVVRQDPDVIFIGEMRDKFTMTAALQAAETGHMVFGSLHTADTMQAFTRILEFFPRNEHEFIRSSLANSLQAICAQRLLPGCQEGVPLVPVSEVLINTPTCRELIRKGQDRDLPALIEASEKEGMHSFTASLARLVQEEFIAHNEAMKYAPNADALASQLRGIKSQAQTMVQRIRTGGGG
jgi:twitching motility protein PilT